jgi:multiple antibiotic resistance protein
MNDAFSSFLLVYAGLFPIVNPVGGAPIFLGITRGMAESRAGIARDVAINSFVLLLASLFIGSYVLDFFGITIPVVRVAGGLVVSAFAWQLLHAGGDVDSGSAGDSKTKPLTDKDSFYPLTLPLTVGPGSIAVAITLGSRRPRDLAAVGDFLLVGIAAVLGLAAIALTIYICYRYAERITGFLGESGTNVLVRLSAFILLCIGISIIWSGYAALTGAPH